MGVLVDTTMVSGEVVAIDNTPRSITLRGPDGNTRTIAVGPAVKRLNEVKIGDDVVFTLKKAAAGDSGRGFFCAVAELRTRGSGRAKTADQSARRRYMTTARVTTVSGITTHRITRPNSSMASCCRADNTRYVV